MNRAEYDGNLIFNYMVKGRDNLDLLSYRGNFMIDFGTYVVYICLYFSFFHQYLKKEQDINLNLNVSMNTPSKFCICFD